MAGRNILELSKGWVLREEPLTVSSKDAPKVLKKKSWLPAAVPGDVRVDLIRAGRIQEPSQGLNAHDSEWVEKRSWWYRCRFTVPARMARYERLELIFDKLDIKADIFLNGKHIAHHATSFRPFVKDIKSRILFDKPNTLAVRLTTGNHSLTPVEKRTVKDLGVRWTHPRHRYENAGVVLRKPEYSFGWDWTARMATCGIAGPVRLVGRPGVYIRDTYVYPALKSAKHAHLSITLDLEHLSYTRDCEVAVSLTLKFKKTRIFQKIQKHILLSGYNEFHTSMEVENPELWWPNGQGPQNMYELDVKVYRHERLLDSREIHFGIRSIKINQKKLSPRERMFTIEVNRRSVFCKGGNWVPADPFPARLSPKHYEKLIAEAAAANFNMLRIWGGGLYEPDIFYELCDRYGIMVWHDFMFACSAYPEEDWFLDEIGKEAEFQIRRLRNHPSIVLWCGNNENNWGTVEWNRWSGDKPWGGLIYADVLFKAVQAFDPKTPYWTSSPFGGPTPNSPDAGDRHCWDWAMHKDPDKRVIPEVFDKQTAKFASEYGHIGPPMKKTVMDYLGQDKEAYADRSSETFKEHVNLFGDGTVEAGIKAFYCAPEGLTTDAFLLYGGLAQGQMYGYSLESFRYRRKECSGAIFWMYNDCWGEIGWTIIDYYLRRKISWYFTRRAFKPLRLILRPAQDKINIRVINDANQSVSGHLAFGYISFDGKTRDVKNIDITARSNGFTDLFRHKLEKPLLKRGVYFAQLHDQQGHVLDTGFFRGGYFKDLNIPPAKPRITHRRKSKGGLDLTITCDTYAHAVHFVKLGRGIPEDDYFDLFPGEEKHVRIENAPQGLDVKCINL